MKTILVHGDNTHESYKRLSIFVNEAKKRGWQIVRIEDSKEDVKSLLSLESLFADNRLFICYDIEAILKNTKWLGTKKDIISGTLIVYSKSEIAKSRISKLPNLTKQEKFILPKHLWAFLESVFPGNLKNSLKLLQSTLTKEPVELVFSLLAKHLRDLWWVKVDKKTLDYPDWRKTKLERQAAHFTLEKLEKLLLSLSDVDMAIKTSRTDLGDSLDFLLATNLE